MIKIKRYDLVNIIYNDLYTYGKLQLFLLLLVLISAMLVIVVTYHTRCMIMNREELLLEKKVLDAEWNNLVLEEKILSNHSRIESIAIDILHMRYTDITQDDISGDL